MIIVVTRRALWVLLCGAVYTVCASLEICLPASRQGAAAVSWNGAVLVVAGTFRTQTGSASLLIAAGHRISSPSVWSEQHHPPG